MPFQLLAVFPLHCSRRLLPSSRIGSANCTCSSSSVMPQSASYLSNMLMSLGWLNPLNTLTCENLVTPVRNTKRREASAQLEHRIESLEQIAVLFQQLRIFLQHIKQGLVVLIDQDHCSPPCLFGRRLKDAVETGTEVGIHSGSDPEFVFPIVQIPL